MTFTQSPVDQTEQDAPAIEHLLDLAFGLNRIAKTSYQLRLGNTPVPGLSLVMRDRQLGLMGAISFWPVAIGAEMTPALLLGPLAVHPERQNMGIGRALITEGLARARPKGHELVLLVGDPPYYARFDFRQVPEGQITLPGPLDPKRLMFMELADGALAKASGMMLPPWRWNEINAPRATT
ncbi:GNAT family N-acetyltransferase [Aestuariivirga litoralis]|uniref:GNAT family N-acetyltransferase n=1 Tax=Aestuariivirga litoralis TaxID=2650924 RepID=UPI0018C46D02|nr:N-acetyltransferase [Aestuariivirga litoralis]MBG1230947.1 N-acetyltransferase [Aestuariivirga litoralis]